MPLSVSGNTCGGGLKVPVVAVGQCAVCGASIFWGVDLFEDTQVYVERSAPGVEPEEFKLLKSRFCCGQYSLLAGTLVPPVSPA